MTPVETARARYRLYALLGRLLVEGPSEEALELARAVPALRPWSESDRELLAAGHHALTTEVPAVRSAVLGEDGLVGGLLGDEVAERYLACGFHPGRTDVPPDHLGLLLACVGHLCAAEEEALEDGQEPSRLRELQRDLLDGLLLSWLPAWAVSARGIRDPLWSTAAELSLELCLSHRASLEGRPVAWRPPGSLPDLDAEDTGLRDVGAALVRPHASGWLPGRTSLTRACRVAGLPSGYGDRGRVLGEALLAAAELGQLPGLLEALELELDAWTGALRSLDGDPPVEGWLEAAARSRALLGRLGSAARAGGAA